MTPISVPSTLEILDRLVAFDTTSAKSNIALVDYVRTLLDAHGIAYEIVPDKTGEKHALVATLPDHAGSLEGGIALSAHTDVVPTEGQNWTRAPYSLSDDRGRVYGRGTTDMKGFAASAIRTLLITSSASLDRPLHLALSYDEEVGCKGIKPLIDRMKETGRVPDMAIIGEPTEMQPVVEHKGKIALSCRVTGEPGHSSYAAQKVNAVIEAARLIHFIAELAGDIPGLEAPDPAYRAPNSSLHVGRISGGGALNMIPETCSFEFETRYRPGFDADALMQRIRSHAHEVLEADMHAKNPQTGFEWASLIEYPPFQVSEGSRALELATRISGRNETGKVDYGTEAGIFGGYGGIDAVVIGPGSMAQGHQPDEFIEKSELEAADRFLEQVADSLKHA